MTYLLTYTLDHHKPAHMPWQSYCYGMRKINNHMIPKLKNIATIWEQICSVFVKQTLEETITERLSGETSIHR